jgi:hypothetical protein
MPRKRHPDGLKLEFVIHEEWLEAKQTKMPNQHLSTTDQEKSGDGEASSQR